MLNYVQVLEAPGWFITHFSKNFSVPLLPSKELPSVHTPAAHRHLSHCGSAARRICGCLVWDSGAARCPLDWDWRWTSPPKAPRSPSRNDRTVWDIHYVLLGLQVIVELWGIFEICCLHSYCSSSQTHTQTLAQAGSFKMDRLLQSSLHWTMWRTVRPSSKVVEFIPVNSLLWHVRGVYVKAFFLHIFPLNIFFKCNGAEYRFLTFFFNDVTRVTFHIQILPNGRMKNWVSFQMMKTESVDQLFTSR